GFLEQLGQSRLAQLLFGDRFGGPLSFDDVAGKVEQLLQKLDTDQDSLLVFLLELLKPLTHGLEARIMDVTAESTGDLDFGRLGFHVRIVGPDHSLQEVSSSLEDVSSIVNP